LQQNTVLIEVWLPAGVNQIAETKSCSGGPWSAGMVSFPAHMTQGYRIHTQCRTNTTPWHCMSTSQPQSNPFRECSGWILGTISSHRVVLQWHSCPGRWCSHCPWRCSRTVWMWHWGMWSVGMVGAGCWTGWSERSFSTLMSLRFYAFICHKALLVKNYIPFYESISQ